MDNLRLGDIIDDYCAKCRRLTNHAIVSIVHDEAAKVRCRSCYHDHDYLREQIPPSKKDLKKLELVNAMLAGGTGTVDPETLEEAAVDPESADIELIASDHAEEVPGLFDEPSVPIPAPVIEIKKPRGRAKKALS